MVNSFPLLFILIVDEKLKLKCLLASRKCYWNVVEVQEIGVV